MKLTQTNLKLVAKIAEQTYRERIVMHTFWTILITGGLTVAAVLAGQLVSAQFTKERILNPALFECAIDPFGFSPHWGAMNSEEELARAIHQIDSKELILPPPYDLPTLTTPLTDLSPPQTEADKREITAKLFYSTRHFGAYDLDSDEYTTTSHPGMDFKMPAGTLVRSIAGGKIHNILAKEDGLGNAIVIEHTLPHTGERVFSIYGHLESTIVERGDIVRPGDSIGTVGQSGDVTAPHLHLQIDRDRGLLRHIPYTSAKDTTLAEAKRFVIHPIDFIDAY
jgi:murein DD-endopeptidase MepM/ murein hydrolase activator NlpD